MLPDAHVFGLRVEIRTGSEQGRTLSYQQTPVGCRSTGLYLNGESLVPTASLTRGEA